MSTRGEPDGWISVFGSSETRDGSRLYETARRVGGLLAEAGFGVVTGGYGGVMEAASRGASEGGGISLGVTCAIFDRPPNRYQTRAIETGDLGERTRRLVDLARAFVVLPGKSGTLAELAFLWALHRAGRLDGKPVVLLGGEWKAIVRHLCEASILDAEQLETTHVAHTPEEAIEVLRQHLPPQGGR